MGLFAPGGLTRHPLSRAPFQRPDTQPYKLLGEGEGCGGLCPPPTPPCDAVEWAVATKCHEVAPGSCKQLTEL
jgi:hypothetical protein